MMGRYSVNRIRLVMTVEKPKQVNDYTLLGLMRKIHNSGCKFQIETMGSNIKARKSIEQVKEQDSPFNVSTP